MLEKPEGLMDKVEGAELSIEEYVDDTSSSDKLLIYNSKGFNEVLTKKLGVEQFTKLRIVGAFLMQGMSIEESAILAVIDPEVLKKLVEDDPEVRSYITFKVISYKAKLMRTLNYTATVGRQDKVAGWLLDRVLKTDSKDDDVSGDDQKRKHILDKGFAEVRELGDSIPLIASGK